MYFSVISFLVTLILLQSCLLLFMLKLGKSCSALFSLFSSNCHGRTHGWDDGSDSILTVWDWLLLFPKWARPLGEKDKIGAVMCWHTVVSWMIGLFSMCLQSKAWNATQYCNGPSTNPKVNQHRSGRKPACALRACNWSHRAQHNQKFAHL